MLVVSNAKGGIHTDSGSRSEEMEKLLVPARPIRKTTGVKLTSVIIQKIRMKSNSWVHPINPSTPPTKSALDDLFADTSTEQKSSATNTGTTPATNTRITRHQTGPTNLGSLLGPSRREKEAKTTSGTSEPTTAPTSVPQQTVPSSEETLRIKRLENEVERLNREIEDVKRRKKEDEQDLERLWKEKLTKKDRDHQEEQKELENSHQKQISKLQDEHSEELERLKSTYERQLDSIQQSAGQWRDVTTVVDKVDNLSMTINQLADNVNMVTERTIIEKETALKLREQQLENREQRLLEDKAHFEDERKKVYELNAKLNELCKGQEKVMEQDKYLVREEWNRLNAEKSVFKEDQQFILENIEKQKEALDRSKTTFFQEQHDLLVRVSTERQLLEQEKNEFYGKRSLDVRRIKEEAGELQRRAQNVLAAEKHLQELEISLMEECVEMENLRNQMSSYKIRTEPDKGPIRNPNDRLDADLASSQDGQDVPPRNESVRTVLKKHSEFLERYMGQKVAAVAPRPAQYGSP
ncbi:hypothetical protein RB195_025680 [Necator americanus]|uniref:Fas-binding factor 1 C-terminal domain-containing protein n=1 Tax=Necator americanus TaxID=51031 RepID=A0ABR1EVH4_NECAM